MATYIAGKSLFNPTLYLAANADVAKAAGNLTGQALADFAFTHFIQYGAAEGRDPLGEAPGTKLPNTLTAGKITGDVGGTGQATGGLFDAVFYLKSNPDVDKAAHDAEAALAASGQTVPSNFLDTFALASQASAQS
jgi:hypothetical protein